MKIRSIPILQTLNEQIAAARTDVHNAEAVKDEAERLYHEAIYRLDRRRADRLSTESSGLQPICRFDRPIYRAVGSNRAVFKPLARH